MIRDDQISEEPVKYPLDSSGDFTEKCALYLSKELNITNINTTGLSFLEASDLSQINKRPFASLVPTYDHPFLFNLLDNALIGKVVSAKLTLRSLQGNPLSTRLHISLIKGNSQNQDTLICIFDDIKNELNLLEELEYSKAIFTEMQQRAKIGIWQRNLITQKGAWSDEMYRIFDLNPEHGPPDFYDLAQVVHADDREEFIRLHDIYIKSGKDYQIDVRLLKKNGEPFWIDVRSETIRDNYDNAIFLCGTAQDITERIQAEEELHSTKELLEKSQSTAKLGGWEIDLKTQKIICTDQVYRILETTREEYQPTLESGFASYLPEYRDQLKLLFDRAVKLNEGFDVEVELLTKKNRRIHTRITCEVILEKETPVKLIGIYQDISEQKSVLSMLQKVNKELAKKNLSLQKLANYDALTQLPNRVLLSDRLEQAIAQSLRHNLSTAVAFIDLDGFKSINDKYGHALGDKFLIKLSKMLKHTLRECDTFSRIGGDEFVAVLTDIKDPSDYQRMIERLLQTAANTVTMHGHQLEVTASIGVTIFPSDNVDAEQLLRHADQAMYLAKQKGKNQYHLFDVSQDESIKNQMVELDRIREAYDNNEFILYYQPKVNSATLEVVGVEALIRWQHPELGLLPPAAFLPIIQDHIFSITLGEWVIDEALSQLEVWAEEGVKMCVSVNIDAIHLQQDDFADQLKEILKKHPTIPPNQLELEILETSSINDIKKVSTVIVDVQSLGVAFALDDFGTGYSSLSYLKQLPVETIKIDQSFIRDMLEDPEDLSIVKGIIGLARAFRRNVIAEGVETEKHREKLNSIGCHLAQGYGIAKPMPPNLFVSWVDIWSNGLRQPP